MIKKNNKGFTLLELLISIFILTTVIFIGYRVINKSTIDIKNQSNINKGQLTMNDMNEYLTKDLEQASSIALFLNNENIADTLVEENNNVEEKQNILSDKISNLKNELNELSIDNKFNYSYAIRFKNDENNTYSIKYKVEIAKSNQYYKYSISREENNGIKISFINEAVLKEKELPFLIEGNSPYKVTLGYTSKDNNFTKHEFTITYRLNDIITTNATNPPDTEVVPPQVDDDLDGDIIFEFTRNDSEQSSNQTNLNTTVKVKDENGDYIERHDQTNNQDINQLSNNRIEIVISKSQIEFYTDSNSYPTINNNQIGKDLNNVKDVLIKIGKNVKVTSEPSDAQKISETEYKVKLRTDGQPSRFTFRFDVTAYGTNKISFTFIEG